MFCSPLWSLSTFWSPHKSARAPGPCGWLNPLNPYFQALPKSGWAKNSLIAPVPCRKAPSCGRARCFRGRGQVGTHRVAHARQVSGKAPKVRGEIILSYFGRSESVRNLLKTTIKAALMIHMFHDDLGQDALAIAHVHPAGGAVRPALTPHQVQARGAGDVTIRARGHRVWPWHQEAHWAHDRLSQSLQKLLVSLQQLFFSHVLQGAHNAKRFTPKYKGNALLCIRPLTLGNYCDCSLAPVWTWLSLLLIGHISDIP